MIILAPPGAGSATAWLRLYVEWVSTESSTHAAGEFPSETVPLIDGPVLAVRRARGPLRPIVLIPDAGRDSRDWAGVAPRLTAAGHEVAAVDLRGHGESEPATSGYDTDTCADDLATLIEVLGYTGGRSPILAGHGWGANVAMSMAARRDGVAGLACFDGGWLRPAWQYANADEYLAAARVQDDATLAGAGSANWLHGGAAVDAVRSIRTSIFNGEPRAWYPLVRVPVLLAPAVPADGEPDPRGIASATRTGVAEASAGLARHRVSWYSGAGHDLPRTRAARVSDDLLMLATASEPAA